MDARHHPFDVISGSLLGIVVAWCAYRQYFPPISEPWHKGRAHPIRAWGTEPKIPRRDYQEMLRDQGSLELSPARGHSRWEDPERGRSESAVPSHLRNVHAQPRSSFPSSSSYPIKVDNASHGDPTHQNEGFDSSSGDRIHRVSSSSSIELARWHPPPSDPGTELPRGRTQARGPQIGRDILSSSTSSLHSHEVEEIDYDMAPPPLSPSKSPQRHSEVFGADTAYHPPAQQSKKVLPTGFKTADDVVDSYVCDHCGLKLHGEDEKRNHVHL